MTAIVEGGHPKGGGERLNMVGRCHQLWDGADPVVDIQAAFATSRNRLSIHVSLQSIQLLIIGAPSPSSQIFMAIGGT